jgi:predicted HNH restriction endonuclease
MTGEFDLGKEEIRPWGEFAEDFIDVHYIFSCILSCNNPNCQKKVLLSGDKAHDYKHPEDISIDQEKGEPDYDIQSIYKIEYFSKSPNIFLFPENLESKIEQTLLESFRLFWIDKKSCLNRLRLTIEILLEKQGFPKNNERETLGSIIERYSKAKPQVGDLLKAIKWAGNDGSHYNTKVVTKENLLSIYMILEEVVKKLYDDSEMKIKNLAHNINTNKGL